MYSEIQTKISELKKHIETVDISWEARNTKEWGGADVIIKKSRDSNIDRWLEDQPLSIGLQGNAPRRRAVITQHSKELSWLFYQLRDLYSEKIDYVSKYDFYGLLAQSANDYLANIDKNEQDAEGLLIAVLTASEGFCKK